MSCVGSCHARTMKLCLHDWYLKNLNWTAPILIDCVMNDVSGIQQFTQSMIKGHGHEKEVHLSFVDNAGTFHGMCRNCRKFCGYWA